MKTTGGLKVSVKDSLNKKKSIHSFDSYTDRDFLSEKKLLKKGAPHYSGMNHFTIPQEKYKSNWNVVSPVKLSTVPNKTLNRYDRDCAPWYPQLEYKPK